MNKLLYPELSYELNGIAFFVQNRLGRFAREKQYGDLYEQKLKENKINFYREYVVAGTRNRVDFLVEDVILLEFKAVPFLKHEDFGQVQRYLTILDIDLGILINFSQKILKPQRILKLPPNNSKNL